MPVSTEMQSLHLGKWQTLIFALSSDGPRAAPTPGFDRGFLISGTLFVMGRI